MESALPGTSGRTHVFLTAGAGEETPWKHGLTITDRDVSGGFSMMLPDDAGTLTVVVGNTQTNWGCRLKARALRWTRKGTVVPFTPSMGRSRHRPGFPQQQPRPNPANRACSLADPDVAYHAMAPSSCFSLDVSTARIPL